MADTFWDRLEPHTRSDELDEGLEARIADPLWMLARQWQAGEFRGEDAASPIHARIEVHTAKVRTYRNETSSSPQAEPLDYGVPLEARVEAEDVVQGPAAIRLAAEAGAQLLRRLDAAGFGSLRAAVRAAFPLHVDAALLVALPARDAQELSLLARRGVDGRALLRAGPAKADAVATAPDQKAKLTAIYAAWSTEQQRRFIEPSATGDAWADERLEYSFSIATNTSDAEVVLRAADYPGGHLDWYAFDADASATHGVSQRSTTKLVRNLMPVPLTYPGMPASRWWELEEGTVYFGGIEAGPADLGRLLVVEYATIYSDDWFLLPLRLPAGSVARIERLDVTDTFGGVSRVRATAALDQEEVGAGKARPWSFFELAGDASAENGRAPILFVPPTLASSLNAAAVERVAFVRDEAANLGWAIEEAIETPNGTSLRRRLQSSLAAQPAAPAAATTDAWQWRVQTSVPPYWIPLLPERVSASSSQVRLRRGRMLGWDDLDPAVVGPQGRILAPERPLRLYEEELPDSGVRVTRAWQAARGADGRLVVWMARRKRPGRGERASGLKFDPTTR